MVLGPILKSFRPTGSPLFRPRSCGSSSAVRVCIDGCPDQTTFIDGCPDQDTFMFALSIFEHAPPWGQRFRLVRESMLLFYIVPPCGELIAPHSFEQLRIVVRTRIRKGTGMLSWLPAIDAFDAWAHRAGQALRVSCNSMRQSWE